MRLITVAFAMAILATPALADDPKDPAMRTAAARARDQELTRQLNLGQLAHVRERDEAYAVGWRAVRDQGGTSTASRDYAIRASEHRQVLADYDYAQADYQQRMAAWRRQVAACKAGNWSTCQ